MRTERLGTTVVVRLAGELDLATAGRAEREITDAATDITAMVVDLDGLSFLASSGLALLVRWRSRATENGFDLRIVATRRQVLRPLQLTELDRLFTICATVDDSLCSLSRRAS